MLAFGGKQDFKSETIMPGFPFEEVPDSLAEFYEYAQSDSVMRVAIVLSDIYSKKDMEFTRGFLLGMKQAELPSNAISLKAINGEIPEDSIYYEMEAFAPHVVVSTFEKDAPAALRRFTRQNGNTLLNVFDTKGDDYIYNDNVFQLIAPSDKFNDRISDYILDNFSGNVLMLVGDPDGTDPAMRKLILSWPEEELMIVSKEDLSVFSFDDETNYLIYPLFATSDDVKDVLKQVLRMVAENPSAGVKIFGKPGWIAFNDLGTMISNLEVYIPAKCYFDPASDSGKRFIRHYNTSYGHAPIRSYPVYAVMGYDTGLYFLPRLRENLLGTLLEWSPENMDQSYFNLKKSDYGGFYNIGSFILHYDPWGTMSKVLI